MVDISKGRYMTFNLRTYKHTDWVKLNTMVYKLLRLHCSLALPIKSQSFMAFQMS